MLEFLTVLPEEVTHAVVPATMRGQVRQEMVGAFSAILQCLEQCMLDERSASVKCQALRCTQSWIQFKIPVKDLSSLITRTLALLPDSETFEAAVEVILELVSHPQSEQYEMSICVGLLPRLTTGWCREKFDEAYSQNDEDFCTNICRLLLGFGQTFTGFLIKHILTPEISSMMEMILKCTAYPGFYGVDEENSEQTLDFWYVLQDTLLDCIHTPETSSAEKPFTHAESLSNMSTMSSSSSIDLTGEFTMSASASVDVVITLESRQRFIEIYTEVVRIVLQKIQYPSEQVWSTWTNESRVTFKKYRRALSDTLVYSHGIIRNDLHALVVGYLNSALTSTDQWQSIEAALFCIKSVSEVVPSTESTWIPAALQIVFSGQPVIKVPRVVQTALLMIGAYSIWISAPQNKDYTFQAINFILPHLMVVQQSSINSPGTIHLNDQSDTAFIAFRALRDICDACRAWLAPTVDLFVEMYISQDLASLPFMYRLQLAECAAQVIEAVNTEKQSGPLQKIIGHISRNMTRLLQGTTSENSDEMRKSITHEVQYLNAVLRGIQLVEEDVATGTKLTISTDLRLCFMRHVQSIVQICWEPLNVALRFWLSDETLLGHVGTFIEMTFLSFKSGESVKVSETHHVFMIPQFSLDFCQSVGDLVVALFKPNTSQLMLDLAATMFSVFGSVAQLSSVLDTASFRQRYPILTAGVYELCSVLAKQLYLLSTNMNMLSLGVLFSNGPISILVGNTSVDSNTADLLARQLEQCPDLAEGYFTLLDRILRQHPESILRAPEESWPSVMSVALASLRVSERSSFRACTQFWIALITVQKRCDHLKSESDAVLNIYGQVLMTELVQGLAGRSSRGFLEYQSEVLFHLHIQYSQQSRAWAVMAMETLTNVDVGAREKYSRLWMGCRQLRRFKELGQEFAQACRGL